jgi:hypothetical protein
MKKIISIFILFFALSVNAQSTSKPFSKVDPKVEAKNDMVALGEVVTLEQTMQDDIFRLFEHKYEVYNQMLSPERETEWARIIEMKLRATLTSGQMDAIEKKEGLLNRLVKYELK